MQIIVPSKTPGNKPVVWDTDTEFARAAEIQARFNNGGDVRGFEFALVASFNTAVADTMSGAA